MDVDGTLVADGKAAEVVEPSQGTLYDPPVAASLLSPAAAVRVVRPCCEILLALFRKEIESLVSVVIPGVVAALGARACGSRRIAALTDAEWALVAPLIRTKVIVTTASETTYVPDGLPIIELGCRSPGTTQRLSDTHPA